MHNRQYRQLKILVSSLALIAAAATLPASADHHESGAAQDHSQHAAPKSAGAAELSEASKAFEEAMMKMHKDMTIPYTNDVDVDFVRGMIPHHQGAIDQANVFLKYTKDLRLRRLALGIIAAQRKEIRFMQRWLKEHEKGLAPGEAPASLDDPSPEDAAPADAAPAAGASPRQ
jgi:uncharacterized protein (DUF305 family)